MSHNSGAATDNFVYRVDPRGDVLYKFPLPKQAGALRDEMVIGDGNVGFATRGSALVAFSVLSGEEIWRWDSHISEISVFAAFADGGCTVQTPAALVEVKDGVELRELMRGKAMMDWQGHVYRKSE